MNAQKNSPVFENPSLSTAQAANILGLGKRTLDNMRSAGRGPTYLKLSNRAIRYLQSDVMDYRESKRVEPVNN